MSILESCPACGSSDVAAMSQQNRALSQTVETLLAEAERLRDGRAETARLRAERGALIEVARVYRAASRDRHSDDDWCTKCFGDGQHEDGCPVGDALAALPLEVRAAIEADEPAGGGA